MAEGITVECSCLAMTVAARALQALHSAPQGTKKAVGDGCWALAAAAITRQEHTMVTTSAMRSATTTQLRLSARLGALRMQWISLAFCW